MNRNLLLFLATLGLGSLAGLSLARQSGYPDAVFVLSAVLVLATTGAVAFANVRAAYRGERLR